MIYVEIIPREIADVIRKSSDASYRCGSINDSIGYETLNDAVIVAEKVGSRFMPDVEPENLLFFFGKTVQSLNYAPIEIPLPPPGFDEAERIIGCGNNEHRYSENQGKAKNRAIILCKLKHSNELEKFLAGKEKNCGYHTKCYEITWRELQELKNNLCELTKHKSYDGLLLGCALSDSCHSSNAGGHLVGAE